MSEAFPQARLPLVLELKGEFPAFQPAVRQIWTGRGGAVMGKTYVFRRTYPNVRLALSHAERLARLPLSQPLGPPQDIAAILRSRDDLS